MSETIPTTAIRGEVVNAYLHCPRKAFLLHCTEDRGTPNDYACILENRASANRASYLAKLQRTNTSTCSYNDRALSVGIEVLTEANLEAASVTAYCDALRIVGQREDSVAYEPTIAVGTYHLEREQMLNLSFVGYVLEQLQGKPPATGYLITIGGECHRVKLTPIYKTVSSILEHVKGWSAKPATQPPPVVLNKHCPYCPYKNVCRQQAEDADDLSLLDRMNPKAIQRYHSKGIFTVKQLSFLFKPRRKRRRAAQPSHFDLEIQALAIRTGKIYIQTVPEIQRSDIELFLDIEGVPDQQFSYLVGLLVRDHEAVRHHAFWADTIEEEESIWRMFIEKAEEYPDAPIYHYGSYEVRAIEFLAKRFGTDVTCLGKRLVNLNSQVYGKVYFPVRSNSLKVLGKFLGASWRAPDASGLQSLAWRYRWEMANEAEYKQKLISYNAEDCQALRILAEKLARLRTDADSELNVDYVDRPKQNAISLGSELHAALDHVLVYASFDHYPKGRISFRPETDAAKKKGPGAPKGHRAYQRAVPVGRRTVIRVPSKRTCPKHTGERLQKSGTDVERVIVDLNFAKTGCRKMVIKYAGEARYCSRCKRRYDPPTIKRLGGQTFGRGFRAWAVYQRIVLRLPYRPIAQAMEELFHETASEASIIRFVEEFAEYYRRTESILVKRLRESPFVHVDETRLSIRGVDHYVWVFTDGRHVIFRLTETRENTVVRELLKAYQGVLCIGFLSRIRWAGLQAAEMLGSFNPGFE